MNASAHEAYQELQKLPDLIAILTTPDSVFPSFEELSEFSLDQLTEWCFKVLTHVATNQRQALQRLLADFEITTEELPSVEELQTIVSSLRILITWSRKGLKAWLEARIAKDIIAIVTASQAKLIQLDSILD